jgi:tetratricopeptide (TPR) repeat protein
VRSGSGNRNVEGRRADGRNASGRSSAGRSSEVRNSEGRNSQGRNSDGRSYGSSEGRSPGGRGPSSRPGGSRSGAGRSGSGRPGERSSSRGDKFQPKWREDIAQPLTAAKKRAAEVDARRGGPRPPIDPDRDQRWADERVTEQWIDEGSVRDLAEAATERATSEAPARREPKPLDPAISAEFVDALGNQRGARLSARLAQASEALDRERFDEARRIAASIVKEAPMVSAVQEVLGLASYRLGRYKPAVAALQAAQELHENHALLPVIADAYRGLRRWAAVERVWGQIKAASPSHDILAEGRIVMANALADQGDMGGAIDVMLDGRRPPKRVRDHHLREWYVIADLYDRVGDTIAARRWFAAVADTDAAFVDVTDRLRGLGR